MGPFQQFSDDLFQWFKKKSKDTILHHFWGTNNYLGPSVGVMGPPATFSDAWRTKHMWKGNHIQSICLTTDHLYNIIMKNLGEFVLFLAHFWLCSGLSPDSILRNHSWSCLGNHIGYLVKIRVDQVQDKYYFFVPSYILKLSQIWDELLSRNL